MAEKILSKSGEAVTRCAQSPYKNRMLPQPILRMRRSLLKILLAMCWLLVPAAAGAAVVEIRTAEKTVATAEFHQGDAAKPAILILHGFLQTREFGIVKAIADALIDNGYSVLSPTLSLGISNRKRSLDCEALHLHDMNGDLQEIRQWVQWLRSQGAGRIIGVGHSFGATQLLAWRERYQERNVDLIGISLMGVSPLGRESSAAPDNKHAARNRPGSNLVHAPLSFCETYTAPASMYASYKQWSADRILAALKRSGPRTDLIQGTADTFAPPNWEGRLAGTPARVHRIAGANHFMEGTHEFDMLDILLGILKR